MYMTVKFRIMLLLSEYFSWLSKLIDLVCPFHIGAAKYWDETISFCLHLINDKKGSHNLDE